MWLNSGMAELRHWHAVCLTIAMWKRVGRLFTIKTRLEAWVVIYAIALGAVERGGHYLETYPGWGGVMLALACTGVVFLAGAKLLDSVRPQPAAVPLRRGIPAPRRRSVTRIPPRSRRTTGRGAARPLSLRKD